MAQRNSMPFELDFLRILGFEFDLDWDNELTIECPEEIDMELFVTWLRKFVPAIKQRLKFEGIRAKECFVGGPYNGQEYFNYIPPNNPLCLHIKRAKWAVYMTKSSDDPRAWFMGYATSKKKGKELKIEKG